MTIRSTKQEERMMGGALTEAGLPASPANVRTLAEWMRAVYLEEVENLASDLAVCIAHTSPAERRGAYQTADRVRGCS